MLPHLAFLLRRQRPPKGLSHRASQQLGSRKSSSQHSQTVLVEGLPPDGSLMLDVASFSHDVHPQLGSESNIMERARQLAQVDAPADQTCFAASVKLSWSDSSASRECDTFCMARQLPHEDVQL